MYTYQLDFYANDKLIASYRDTKQRLYCFNGISNLPANIPAGATHWRLTQITLPRQLEAVPSGFYGSERREE